MVRNQPGIDRRAMLGGFFAFAAASVVKGIAKADAQPSQAPELAPLRTGALAAPPRFMWGAATSGHQIEGNNLNSDCWLLENVKPSIYKERSGDACDSYHRYEEDISLLKSFGFDSYRFSIEWSRIAGEGFRADRERALLCDRVRHWKIDRALARATRDRAIRRSRAAKLWSP
jgi:beta-glucosidase